MKYWFALLLTLSLFAPVYAAEALPMAPDPVLEQRLLAISVELRCLVCQNESLAGSRADLAEDLRREIRILIKQNKTDAEIMEFMVSRYGDFVRYRPPVKPLTWLLWFGPFVLLAGGFIVLVRRVRHSNQPTAARTLDTAQRDKARSLLDATDATP